MPSFRYRALTQSGELVSGSIAAPTAAEVAHRIEYLGLVPIETVAEGAARRRRGLQPGVLVAAQARGRHRLHPRPRAAAAGRRPHQRRARAAGAGHRRRPAAADARQDQGGGAGRRELRRGDRAPSGLVSAGLCGAGAGRRGLRHARSDSRGARRRAGARRGAAPQARRCAALSGLRAVRGRRRAVVLSVVRAAAIRDRAARFQRQARPGGHRVSRPVRFPARPHAGRRRRDRDRRC